MHQNAGGNGDGNTSCCSRAALKQQHCLVHDNITLICSGTKDLQPANSVSRTAGSPCSP
jgi:hypothetical protein